MRSLVDFYRARPLVGVIVFFAGLALAVATVSLQDGDGVLLPILFAILLGLVIGACVGLSSRSRRRREGDEPFDFDAAENDQ